MLSFMLSVGQTVELPVIGDAMTLMWYQFNDNLNIQGLTSKQQNHIPNWVKFLGISLVTDQREQHSQWLTRSHHSGKEIRTWRWLWAISYESRRPLGSPGGRRYPYLLVKKLNSSMETAQKRRQKHHNINILRPGNMFMTMWFGNG